MTPQEMVTEFHEVFGHPIRPVPGMPDQDERALREDLIFEEANEFVGANVDGSIVEAADALADLLYVVYGAALVYGIDLDHVVAAVHESNMTKLGPDGRPQYRADGKVLKGPDYRPPRIAEALDSQRPLRTVAVSG